MNDRRRLTAALGAFSLAVALLASFPAEQAASAPAITAPYRVGTVLVRFRDGATSAERAAARAAVGSTSFRPIAPNLRSVQVVSVPANADIATVIARLQREPAVLYAEPDYIVHELATSNDPKYTDGTLWGMEGDASTPANRYGSQAAEAWAAGFTGSRAVAIGVIDEGEQWSHPDLAANAWVNPVEASGRAGVDDDGNGYVDDLHGWDFYNHDATTYDGTGDSHGTHVAGTIGGVGGNGAGVAGVNWNVTLIPLKFLGPQGGALSDAVSALYYLIDLKSRHHVNVVATNNSWGGGGYTQTLRDAITAAGNAGMLFVAAAGNDGTNDDTTPLYPASYVCQATWGDCVIAVAAIDATGAMPSWSSYGPASVDLGAPGASIYSTVPSNTYGTKSGTSMATPHVSGAVALCASINPSATPAQIRQWVLDGTATSSLSGRTVTGDRLDIGRMWSLCQTGAGGGGGGGTPTTATVTLSISGKGSVTLTVGGVTATCSSSCTQTYAIGASVTLVATAASGFSFKGWSGACTGLSATCSLTLDAGKSVSASFKK